MHRAVMKATKSRVPQGRQSLAGGGASARTRSPRKTAQDSKERPAGPVWRNEPSSRWNDEIVKTDRGMTGNHATGRKIALPASNHGTASGNSAKARHSQGFRPGLRKAPLPGLRRTSQLWYHGTIPHAEPFAALTNPRALLGSMPLPGLRIRIFFSLRLCVSAASL